MSLESGYYEKGKRWGKTLLRTEFGPDIRTFLMENPRVLSYTWNLITWVGPVITISAEYGYDEDCFYIISEGWDRYYVAYGSINRGDLKYIRSWPGSGGGVRASDSHLKPKTTNSAKSAERYTFLFEALDVVFAYVRLYSDDPVSP